MKDYTSNSNMFYSKKPKTKNRRFPSFLPDWKYFARYSLANCRSSGANLIDLLADQNWYWPKFLWSKFSARSSITDVAVVFPPFNGTAATGAIPKKYFLSTILNTRKLSKWLWHRWVTCLWPHDLESIEKWPILLFFNSKDEPLYQVYIDSRSGCSSSCQNSPFENENNYILGHNGYDWDRSRDVKCNQTPKWPTFLWHSCFRLFCGPSIKNSLIEPPIFFLFYRGLHITMWPLVIDWYPLECDTWSRARTH